MFIFRHIFISVFHIRVSEILMSNYQLSFRCIILGTTTGHPAGFKGPSWVIQDLTCTFGPFWYTISEWQGWHSFKNMLVVFWFLRDIDAFISYFKMILSNLSFGVKKTCKLIHFLNFLTCQYLRLPKDLGLKTTAFVASAILLFLFNNCCCCLFNLILLRVFI